MEELSALLDVNDWYNERRYDVIVLDCAPAGESLRFVAMPTTMKWYRQHIFPFERGLLKRPGTPEPARRHFDASRPEFLKGLRALVDARIAQCSKRNARGEKSTSNKEFPAGASTGRLRVQP